MFYLSAFVKVNSRGKFQYLSRKTFFFFKKKEQFLKNSKIKNNFIEFQDFDHS